MSKLERSLSIWLVGTLGAVILSLSLAGPLTALAQFSPDQQTGLNLLGQTAYESSQPRDIRLVVGDIIKTFLGLIGFLLVVLMIISGLQYLTAAGSKDKITSAIKRIQNAFIGLIIILVAYAATVFILRALVRATAGV